MARGAHEIRALALAHLSDALVPVVANRFTLDDLG
jgi:hypothetical protein